VPESQESNNTGLRTFQIGPDLAVPNLSGPSQATAGAPFVVTDTTTNQGGGAAGGSTVAFYLSTNWTFDASDTSLNVSRTLPALAAGGTSSAQTTLTIPAGTASGTYYIIAKADPQNALAETSESNNTDWFAITVTP
jgi:subtilase family serine protease